MDLTTELVRLEAIFKDNVYKVPSYQRPIAWTPDDYEQLWSDLLESSRESSGSNGHFFGVIVVIRRDNHLEIVDGQQRLAALHALYLAVYVFVKDKNATADQSNERNILPVLLSTAQNFFGITLTDFREQSSVLRLELGQRNSEDLRNLWDRRDSPELAQIPTSVARNTPKLRKAFYNYLSKMHTHFDGDGDGDGGEPYKELTNFIQVIQNSKIVQIKAANDADAFELFESLNSKGQSLGAIDLIKNKLVQRTKPSARPQVVQRWNSVFEKFSSETDGSRVLPAKFFRHYYIQEWFERVSAAKLYRSFETKMGESSALDFIDKLDLGADQYISLTNVGLEYPGIIVRRGITDLDVVMAEIALLGYEACLPLLLLGSLSGWNNLNSIAKKALVLLFRGKTVGDVSGATIEEWFYELIVVWRDSEVSESVESALDALLNDKDELSDERFKRNLGLYQAEPKVGKYFHTKIAFHELGIDWVPNNSSIDLEHILPKNSSEHWVSFTSDPSEDREKYYKNLGNMILLSRAVNRRIQNFNFDRKKDDYREAWLPDYENDILNMTAWSMETIEHRNNKLAEKALTIWGLPQRNF